MLVIVPPQGPPTSGPCEQVSTASPQSSVADASLGSQAGTSSMHCTFVSGGQIDEKLMRLILVNVRTPTEREGDFTAQIMANITGMKRLVELSAKYGREVLLFYAAELQNYTERVTRETIRVIPDGTYAFEDHMDDDGITEKPLRIRVTVTVSGDSLHIDFSGSDRQVRGSVNAVYAITLSAVLYVVRALMPEEIPTNGGVLRPITLVTEKGSIVDSEFPSAVAGGNVETSQRIVDVLLGALGKAVPHRIPAAAQGTMNNVAIGGIDERTGEPFAYYETIGGGMGAGEGVDGASAVHSNMTNTLNTPIEALEYSYPFLVREYSVRRRTGGKGACRGGDGIVREIELLSDADATVLSERRRIPPYGMLGGEPGCTGKNRVVSNGKVFDKGGKFYAPLAKGDFLRIETPGGGGYGIFHQKKEEEK